MADTVAIDFIAALADDLDRRVAADPALASIADALRRASRDVPGPSPQATATPMLETALAGMAGDAAMVAAARAAAARVGWYRVYDGADAATGIAPDLAAGMFGGQVAGSRGLIGFGGVLCGLFLLVPGIHYPLHTHAATELYYCLSGNLSVEHGVDGERFTLAPGDHSVTPSHRLHALSTGNAPVLLAYAWVDEQSAPIWMWERDATTPLGWRRRSWTRRADASWQCRDDEPVDTESFRRATDP